MNVVSAMRCNSLLPTRDITLRHRADPHTCTFDIITPISAGVNLLPRIAEGASDEGVTAGGAWAKGPCGKGVAAKMFLSPILLLPKALETKALVAKALATKA